MLTQLFVCGRVLLAYGVFEVVGETALHAQAANDAIWGRSPIRRVLPSQALPLR